ncbi:Crp/Fnr family transcriptional regulator [Dyadobacter chenwenxiniae]|uniref:Crp/Fnr family transcriptional regulator n=1 Tax=Dyadobacter chenwenxiniae TaxID=2906456 RepID=A0A9X1TG84_9BACT|nr:Crp/Fnr family transcriptional regulator [Dyadobacter chenwenxiniae]MCF0065231.1 Crp/Fnr family transcriptional regulator [Dyadobacter chenwenxiniae]UON84499.1 Crp/Fnr family transcriptional regulator [Dyadobacter chenwenxiniae]
MRHPLIEHISKQVQVAPEEEALILSFFQSVRAKKKQNLVEAGNPCSALFFVVEGCIRMFHLSEKGIEQTIQFALENWWLTDFSAFTLQQNTGFTIQAVENSELLVIDVKNQERLLEQLPKLERYFRFVYQRGYGAAQVRMKFHHDLSREKLYQNFVENYPQFVQRVPQYLIASYLGFTPEYLSELRKKRS